MAKSFVSTSANWMASEASNVIRPHLWELVDRTREAITSQHIIGRPERLAECLPK